MAEHPIVHRRILCAKELVETEDSYVHQLNTTVELYCAPLRAQLAPSGAATHTGKAILTADELKCVFRNIETLAVMHTKFLAELKARWVVFESQPANEQKHVLSDVILKFVPFFKLYTEFANHHDDANDMLKTLLHDSSYTRFQNFERQCRAAPQSKGLGLTSLLITPIQRVPRYKLLLEELLRHTDTSHADYHGLVQAFDHVKKLALHINEEVRASENRRVMLQLQDELSGSDTLLAPHRVFVRKGMLTKVCTDKHEPLQFYLFNDLLLYAVKVGWKWKVKQTIVLDSKFQVESMPDRPAYKAFPFKLVAGGHASRAMIVYTADLFEKNSWLMDLHKVVADLKSKHGAIPGTGAATAGPAAAGTPTAAGHVTTAGGAAGGGAQAGGDRDRQSSSSSSTASSELAPVWQPNELAVRCTRCLRKFGLLRRKHHCRKCGKVVCADCSPHRLKLASAASEGAQVRVCNACNDLIQAKAADETLKRSKSSVIEAEKDSAVAALIINNNRASGAMAPGTADASSAAATSRPDSVMTDQWHWVPHPQLAFVLARFLRTESTASIDLGKAPVPSSAASTAVPGATVAGVAGGAAAQPPQQQPQQTHVFRTLEGENILVPGDLSQYTTASLDTITADIDNLVHLSAQEFSPAAILHQLSTRYRKDLIYTAIGTILISINPFKPLPLYTADRMHAYAKAEEHTLAQLSPHVFAVAAKAYRNLSIAAPLPGAAGGGGAGAGTDAGTGVSSGGSSGLSVRDQAIVISGESGSGKTEATKLILSFLAEVARTQANALASAALASGATPPSAAGLAQSFSVDQEILQSNPLLESFGNAKTVRNDNSSRFGKWMGVVFNEQRTIAGGRIVTYLLEKTRVVTQMDSERNYHVFYQLCAAAQAAKKPPTASQTLAGAGGGRQATLTVIAPPTPSGAADEGDVAADVAYLSTLGLGHARGFHYLNQSGCYTIDGVDDVEHLTGTVTALHRTGFTSEQVQTLCRLLAAILHLGNIEITSDLRELDVRTAAALLQIEPKALLQNLKFRVVEMIKGVEGTAIPLSHTDSVAARDALAKALYARLFEWLVARINVSMAAKQASAQAQDDAVDAKAPHPAPGHGHQHHARLSGGNGTGVGSSFVSGKASIGVLDIFGFESFDINSLEQFFINYTNEKLHSHFNHCIFQAEREDYHNEGIELEAVAFADNSICLELIESSFGSALRRGANGPQGILQLLDEEVSLPKGNDAHLMERLLQAFDAASLTVNKAHLQREQTMPTRARAGVDNKAGGAGGAGGASPVAGSDAPPLPGAPVAPPAGSNPYFQRVLKRPNCFVVKHFCGATEYVVDGFVSKNRDKLADSLSQLLHGSKTPLLADLFNTELDLVATAGLPGGVAAKEAREAAAAAATGGANAGGDVNDSSSLAYLMREEKRRAAAKTAANSTIAYQFRNQLDALMTTLRASQSHFVKCIKPNARKAPFDLDGALVLSQMKSGGLVEALRINQRSKFSCRLLYRLFYQRYAVLATEANEKLDVPASDSKTLDNADHARKACEKLLTLFPNLPPLKHFFVARQTHSVVAGGPQQIGAPVSFTAAVGAGANAGGASTPAGEKTASEKVAVPIASLPKAPVNPLAVVERVVRLGKSKVFYGAALRNALESMLSALGKRHRAEERKKNPPPRPLPEVPPKPQVDAKPAAGAAAPAAPAPASGAPGPSGGAGPAAAGLPPMRQPKVKPQPPPLPKHIQSRANARSTISEIAPALVFVLPPLPSNARALLSPRQASGTVAPSAGGAAAAPPGARAPPVRQHTDTKVGPTPPPVPKPQAKHEEPADASRTTAASVAPPIPPKPSISAALTAAAAGEFSGGNDVTAARRPSQLSIADATKAESLIAVVPGDGPLERSDSTASVIVDEDEYQAYYDDWYLWRANFATSEAGASFGLDKFKRLRSIPDYLSGVFWNRDALKHSFLVFQKKLIARSLTCFDADYVEAASVVLKQSFYPNWKPSSNAAPQGASAAQVAAAAAKRTGMYEPATARLIAKQLASHSVPCFENILNYTGELYHAFPVTCGFAVLTLLRKEPLLADEIYAQLIKQTTVNASNASTLLAWKLLYLCLHVSPPLESRAFVLSHILRHSTQELPALPPPPAGVPAASPSADGSSSPRAAAAAAAAAQALKDSGARHKQLPGASLFVVDLSSVEHVATLCYLQYKWLLASMLRRGAAAAAKASAGGAGSSAVSPLNSPVPHNLSVISRGSAATGPAVIPLYTPPHLWSNPLAMGAAEAALFDLAYVTRITQTNGILSTAAPHSADDDDADAQANEQDYGDEQALDRGTWKREQKAKEDADAKARSLERLKARTAAMLGTPVPGGAAGSGAGAAGATLKTGPPPKVALFDPPKPAVAAVPATPPLSGAAALAAAKPAAKPPPPPATVGGVVAAAPVAAAVAPAAATKAPVVIARAGASVSTPAGPVAAAKPKFCVGCGKARPGMPPTDKFCAACGHKHSS